MVEYERCQAVAVVAGDAVSSLDSAEFLRRADETCRNPDMPLPSPCIPNGYDRVARWHMAKWPRDARAAGDGVRAHVATGDAASIGDDAVQPHAARRA